MQKTFIPPFPIPPPLAHFNFFFRALGCTPCRKLLRSPPSLLPPRSEVG